MNSIIFIFHSFRLKMGALLVTARATFPWGDTTTWFQSSYPQQLPSTSLPLLRGVGASRPQCLEGRRPWEPRYSKRSGTKFSRERLPTHPQQSQVWSLKPFSRSLFLLASAAREHWSKLIVYLLLLQPVRSASWKKQEKASYAIALNPMVYAF